MILHSNDLNCEIIIIILFQVGNDGLTSLTIRRMTEMRDNNSTIAFIGPDGHYCADEALVSAAWNLPMITHVKS
jgi:hypothetical protein